MWGMFYFSTCWYIFDKIRFESFSFSNHSPWILPENISFYAQHLFDTNFFSKTNPYNSQPTRNIRGIFAVCSLSVATFGTSREHLGNILEEKIFLKVLDGKVVFVLKAHDLYDLIITNVDLLANSSNHKVMFPEYSRNIPRMSISKVFQGYPGNIVKLWKYFRSQKVQKLFCRLSCENFNIGSFLSCSVFLNFIETVLYLE